MMKLLVKQMMKQTAKEMVKLLVKQWDRGNVVG
jgi:hypothetical protein